MAHELAQLDLFYGDLTVNRAYVYARLPTPAENGGWSLTGQVRGPRCLQAQTLPITSPLVDLGPGPTLLARAVVPDPCFWSPDLPAMYDVTVNLLRGTDLVASVRREIGLRSLGVRGRHLALESKRWVLRGICTDSTLATLPRHWHEASACFVTNNPDEELLAEASQWGALVVAQVCGSPGELAARLRQLTTFPAIGIAIVRGELAADFQASSAAPNLLLAQPLARGDVLEVRTWPSLLWAETDDPLLLGRITQLADLPVIVSRQLPAPAPLPAARAACDALQRDLAPIGQFAGYVV